MVKGGWEKFVGLDLVSRNSSVFSTSELLKLDMKLKIFLVQSSESM